MKRTSAIVLIAGTVGFLLAGCGGGDESTDANGLRKGSVSATAAASAARTTTASGTATSTAPADTDTTTTTKQRDPALGPASSTTCGEFRKLDTDAEKALIEQILAENPGGPFDGSPNVALGTAKLVCLAPSVAGTSVAVAAGIVEK
ncbi:hypothetical protein [Nocardia implantans]|uniref:DUF732 domain-containing protein n=1 Tax=Nocardia implantans TaxID=3108168 RepID=A0ABU6ALT2_9NOCA|nr:MULTISPECIES: hypothetical protein [unclassified Nocardia]MBF6193307.1 hypothetical protein [Nocardia beijingensis]MEA3531555.1 hypothetical protein [Nocardia sp. CDC192]MEB3508407.1 hypothetical protein [Nocardia sp. CDC186]